LVEDENCWAFLPPNCVASGSVVSVTWSPTGKQLLASVTEVPSRDYQTALRGETAPARNTNSCMVWFDLGKPSGKVVIRSTSASSFSNLTWRSDSQVAFVIEQTRTKDGSQNQLKALGGGSVVGTWNLPGSAHQISADRRSNLVVVGGQAQSDDGTQSSLVHAIDGNLKLVPVAAPSGYSIMFPQAFQREDGLYVMLREAGDRGSKAAKTIVGWINPETLTIDRVDTSRYIPTSAGDTSPLGFAARPAADGLKNLVAFRNQPVKASSSALRRDPWAGPIMMVAGESELFWESPNDSAIAYSSQGLLMVREIVKCDKRIYEAALDALVRREQMVKAKEIGMAFHMYAADNEDALPGSLKDLEPYLKNRNVLDGFVFTATQSKIGDGSPSTTEIGYIAGNGGRVVLYGDGHVRWQPDK